MSCPKAPNVALVSLRTLICIAALLGSVACESARLPVSAGIGPRPELPPPRHPFVPVVNIAPARGWAVPAAGLAVSAFVAGLDHPRWLYVLPNGDVLVAETNAPPKPDDNKGIKGWFFKRFQKKAGARRCRVPTASRCCAMPTGTASPSCGRSS